MAKKSIPEMGAPMRQTLLTPDVRMLAGRRDLKIIME
jgi:hypothetical protein